jgi:hypothetical protein
VRNVVIGVVVALVVALGTLGYIAWVQNSAREAMLSLDLGFAAWELSAPMPVLGLVGIAFLSGLGLGVLGMGVRSLLSGSGGTPPPSARRAAGDAPRPY